MRSNQSSNIVTALIIAVAVALIVTATLDNIGYGLSIAAVIGGGIYAARQKSKV